MRPINDLRRIANMTALGKTGGSSADFRLVASTFIRYPISMLVVFVDGCQELYENWIAFKRSLQDLAESSRNLLERDLRFFFPEAVLSLWPGYTCRFANKANDVSGSDRF